MTDQPMTLRERIAELENDLAEGRYGSTMHDAGSAREFVCENLKRHLDETADADAEQARLAAFGAEVQRITPGGYEELIRLAEIGALTEKCATGRRRRLTIYVGRIGGRAEIETNIYGQEAEAPTLLEALRELAEKVNAK